ncbi:hypothetical protein GCM10028790_00900 [Micromonospora taraxaci]
MTARGVVPARPDPAPSRLRAKETTPATGPLLCTRGCTTAVSRLLCTHGCTTATTITAAARLLCTRRCTTARRSVTPGRRVSRPEAWRPEVSRPWVQSKGGDGAVRPAEGRPPSGRFAPRKEYA